MPLLQIRPVVARELTGGHRSVIGPELNGRHQRHPASLDVESVPAHWKSFRLHVFSFTPTTTLMMKRLRYTLAIFAMAAVLLPTSAAATPSDTTKTQDRVAPEKVELLRLLNSDSVSEQKHAVRRIGTHAYTGRRDANFFDRLVAPLHGLMINGETEALRIMAVSALASIGTDSAILGLRVQVDDIASPRVERLAQNALDAHTAHQIAAKKR